MIRDLIIKNRSYRRFKEKEDIKEETLKELMDENARVRKVIQDEHIIM